MRRADHKNHLSAIVALFSQQLAAQSGYEPLLRQPPPYPPSLSTQLMPYPPNCHPIQPTAALSCQLPRVTLNLGGCADVVGDDLVGS